MGDDLSTKEMGWVLGRSPAVVRRMIQGGELEAERIPGAYRVPRSEAVRVGRERIEREAGRTLSDAETDRLIDQVIATNEART